MPCCTMWRQYICVIAFGAVYQYDSHNEIHWIRSRGNCFLVNAYLGLLPTPLVEQCIWLGSKCVNWEYFEIGLLKQVAPLVKTKLLPELYWHLQLARQSNLITLQTLALGMADKNWPNWNEIALLQFWKRILEGNVGKNCPNCSKKMWHRFCCSLFAPQGCPKHLWIISYSYACILRQCLHLPLTLLHKAGYVWLRLLC